MIDSKNKYDKNSVEYQTLLAMLPPMGGAQDLNVFDIYAQAAITDLVRRNVQTVLEQLPDIGIQIAPLVPCYDRTLKREIAEIAAFGAAQFRAPDASPSIFVPKMAFTQEAVSLLLPDEMSEIKEDLWLRMHSPDESIRARAGVDLVTLGRILQIRNEVSTSIMRWTMLKGQTLTVNYDTGSGGITWPYMASHKISAATPWTDPVGSTPIDDLRSGQQLVANDIGVYASMIHMNTVTFSHLQRANQTRGYLTPTDRNVYLPTASDIESLLWGGGANTDDPPANVAPPPKIVTMDAGYRNETQGYNRGMGALTKYLNDGEVLMTVQYVHEGERIADVADGMVGISTAFDNINYVQGPQSEIIIDHRSKTHFLRQASARFARLRRPEGVAFLTTQ